MAAVQVIVDRRLEISEIDPRIYGSFAEHMGRCIYGGIYEPGSPFADEDGFRSDVIELVKEMGVTIVRYPGGNFLSGYDWKDGIGPLSERKQRLDLAWHCLETNQFGLDQFMAWTKKANVEPMMAMNLGSAGLKDALELLEYTNIDADSQWANLRKENGTHKAHDVKVWCLGNEMDGPWQLGHKSATNYGTLAADVARGMRQIDSDLELVVCGSSGHAMPTFGQWEETVLEHTYDLVDHISLHIYVEDGGDTQSFLTCATELDGFIENVTKIADTVKAKKRSEKTITLSLDEWNVWRLSEYSQLPKPTEWEIAPRVIEDEYTVADAVVVGSLLISILKHSDRVKMACQAQLVNVIGPIRVEKGHPAWRQTIFFPFAYTAKYGNGTALVSKVNSPMIETKKYGSVSALDAVTTYDAANNCAAIFLVNRSLTETHTTEIELAGFSDLSVIEQVTLTDKDLTKTNTLETGEQVKPVSAITATVSGTKVSITLPPASWQMVRLSLKQA